MKRSWLFGCTLTGCMLCPLAHSEVLPVEWTVGIGVSYASDAFRDVDGASQTPSAEFEPYLELSAGPLTLSPESVSLTVLEWMPASDSGQDDEWELLADLYVEFDTGDRYQGTDTVFDGMDSRTGQRVFGIATDWYTPVGLISGDLARYTGNDAGGQHVKLSWGVPLWLGERLDVIADVGLDWLSREKVQYDYGVRDHEARPGRPAWHPGSASIPRAGLVAEYGLRDHWTLFGALDVSRRPGALRRSPLTDGHREDFYIEIGVILTSD